MLLFDPTSGRHCAVDLAGLAVWRAMDGRPTLRQVAEEIAAEADADEAAVLQDLLQFANTLDGLDLLENDIRPLPGVEVRRDRSIDALAPLPAGPFPVDVVLRLGDRDSVVVRALDAEASGVLGVLARVARLEALQPSDVVDSPLLVEYSTTDPPGAEGTSEQEEGRVPRGSSSTGQAGSPEGRARGCRNRPAGPLGEIRAELQRLSAMIGEVAQERGGVLLHAGLAARPGATEEAFAGDDQRTIPGLTETADGGGAVLLVGRSGVGKSTAAGRFPPPWRSLCDDLVLLVTDGMGGYLAHPWPTWSAVLGSAPDRTWDVQRAVPLKGVFVLEQSPVDRASRVGAGQAAAWLLESAAQASLFRWRRLDRPAIQLAHRRRFESVCRLAIEVPCFQLDLTIDGPFWRVIEDALCWS